MKKKLFGKNKPQEANLLMIVFVMVVLLSLFTKNFMTMSNISNLFRQTSINGVIALGMTFVIITAGIDLSVGAVVGIASVTLAQLLVSGTPLFFAIILTILIGTLVGVINGLIIEKGKVPPFIATLGMMQAARGLVMLMSSARMISGLPKAFTKFSRASIIGLPSLFIIWVVLVLITYFISAKTVFGRNIFAYGSNIEAARLSGVNTAKVTIYVYAISGLLSAIAGIMLTSRLGNGIPTAGVGYEMDAIAAAVVGGASLMGGSGTILGTVLGAFLISLIQNGGNLLGVNSFILQIIVGAIIVASVWVDQIQKSKQ
jgi:ribose transport system permease protein